MEEAPPSERIRTALIAHKNDLDDVTFWRWMQRLPIQLERVICLPKLARALAEEAEERALSEADTPAK